MHGYLFQYSAHSILYILHHRFNTSIYSYYALRYCMHEIHKNYQYFGGLGPYREEEG